MWTVAEFEIALGVRAERLSGGANDLTGDAGVGPDGSASITGLKIDSRAILSGDCFVSIRGENTDGHRYVAGAAQRGATTMVAARSERTLVLSELAQLPVSDLHIFWVENTDAALADLARFHRREKVAARVIAITGSNGKTTTKDMLASLGAGVLGADRVAATQGNLNNHWGLPLTMLAVRPEARLAIVELGMNHPGEIELLSRIARPHLSAIVSIAAAHIGHFKDLKEIARAKLEILAGMGTGEEPAILYYPRSAPLQDEARALARQKGVRLELTDAERQPPIQVGRSGIALEWRGHSIQSANYFTEHAGVSLALCLDLLLAAGLSEDDIVRAAPAARPHAPRRFQVFRRSQAGREHLLVDDSYNANEASFCEALRALRRLDPSSRLAVLAGEMGELGEESRASHERVGRLAAELGYAFVGVSGGHDARSLLDGYRAASAQGAGLHRDTPEELHEALKTSSEFSGCDDVIIKGSRSARMDVLSDTLRTDWGYA